MYQIFLFSKSNRCILVESLVFEFLSLNSYVVGVQIRSRCNISTISLQEFDDSILLDDLVYKGLSLIVEVLDLIFKFFFFFNSLIGLLN